MSLKDDFRLKASLDGARARRSKDHARLPALKFGEPEPGWVVKATPSAAPLRPRTFPRRTVAAEPMQGRRHRRGGAVRAGSSPPRRVVAHPGLVRRRLAGSSRGTGRWSGPGGSSAGRTGAARRRRLASRSTTAAAPQGRSRRSGRAGRRSSRPPAASIEDDGGGRQAVEAGLGRGTVPTGRRRSRGHGIRPRSH